MSRARLYGLDVETDFALHDVADGFEGEADITVRSLPRFARWPEPPAGEVLLDFSTGEDHWYMLVREPSGRFVLQVPTVCVFVIEPDLREVTVALHVDAEDGMDAVLTTGTLLSCLLYLRGLPVLHGSAVQVDDGAVGFIGHSGQGKTTMAAALCAEGAAVVTDDVLVVDGAGGGRPTVRRGSRELRLRQGTLALLTAPETTVTRVTVDERSVLTPHHGGDDLPLTGLVIPRPRRDATPLQFERLTAKDAVLALLAFPRLMGWRDRRVLADVFAAATTTAARVPVVVAHVPWDRPFDPGLTDALRTALHS